MIQYRHQVIWVEQSDGRREPFDPERLSESVERAASLAGYAGAMLGESLAAAVQLFAVHTRRELVLKAGDIAQFVATVLNSIGYTKIAAVYQRRYQHAEIRLDQMAQHTATGFELGFYRQLDRALDVAGDGSKTIIQLCGLRQCVMRLRGAQRWTQQCARLADEIINHVRSRAARIRPLTHATLHLSVIE